MKDSYDFANGVKNPYISKQPKQQVTIRLDVATVQYFKELAAGGFVPEHHQPLSR